MENNKHARWRKRLSVVNAIYEDFVNEHAEIDNLAKTCFEDRNFDHFQIEIIESYVANQK